MVKEKSYYIVQKQLIFPIMHHHHPTVVNQRVTLLFGKRIPDLFFIIFTLYSILRLFKREKERKVRGMYSINEHLVEFTWDSIFHNSVRRKPARAFKHYKINEHTINL